jgi:hypothetical protein
MPRQMGENVGCGPESSDRSTSVARQQNTEPNRTRAAEQPNEHVSAQSSAW